MKYFDLMKALLEKNDECPNCKGKLRQERRRKIECETCGFRVYTTSRYREHITILSAYLSIAILVAIVFAFELFKHLK